MNSLKLHIIHITTSVIGGGSDIIPNTNCYILNNGSMPTNGSMRVWETWETSEIDMRHGAVMPFQGGYLAMGLTPGYFPFSFYLT